MTLRQLEDDFDCHFKSLSSPAKAKFENTERNIEALKETSIYRRVDNKYLKCYSMRILITEPRYRSILFGQYAIINLTNSNIVYLTDFEKSLIAETKQFQPGFKLKKVTKQVRNHERCENYDKNSYCDSSQNCLEKCYLIKFAEKYNSIQFSRIPIQAQYFKQKDIKFNLSIKIDKKIIEKCKKLYQLKECDETYITSHDNEIGEVFTKHNNNLVLNTNFEHNIITNIQITNPFELIFHILTLCSVLFGLSVPNIVFFIIGLTKFNVSNFKFFKKFLFILSLVGFSAHVFLISKDILYSDLIPEYSSNFDFLETNKNLPILIFCVPHNIDLDNGPTLTGRKLYDRTSFINATYVFEKITYYDLNYKENNWYPNETEPENLNLDFFFINRYKCFEIHYKLEPRNIYGSYVHNILRVFVNSSFDQYLLTYRANNSYNLIDYYYLNKSMTYFFNFEFMHEIFSDRFQKLRNPMLLFKKNLKENDVKDYIKELRDELKQIDNCTTTSIPLFKEDLDYEIKNDVFKNMINYIIKPRESTQPSNADYERTYFVSLVTYYNETGAVILKKIFFSGDLFMENKDDTLTIMCNLLNAVSVWFNLSLIDLAHYFDTFLIYSKLIHLFKKLKDVNNLNDLKKLFKKKKQLKFKKADYVTNLVLIDKTKKRIRYLERS